MLEKLRIENDRLEALKDIIIPDDKLDLATRSHLSAVLDAKQDANAASMRALQESMQEPATVYVSWDAHGVYLSAFSKDNHRHVLDRAILASHPDRRPEAYIADVVRVLRRCGMTVNKE